MVPTKPYYKEVIWESKLYLLLEHFPVATQMSVCKSFGMYYVIRRRGFVLMQTFCLNVCAGIVMYLQA